NPGRSFVLNTIGSNLGSVFVTLEPFEERPGLSADDIAAALRRRFKREIPEARINVFGAPAVDGLGNAGGFKLMVQAVGDVYFNDFNRFGRTWQVNIQADAVFRANAETVKQFKVRNLDGDMAPLGSVIDIREKVGPLFVTRYNMFPAATITGASLPGVSTGDVLRSMEALADKELPRSMTYEWTELSFLQKQSSKIEQFRDLRQNPFSAFVLGAVLV